MIEFDQIRHPRNVFAALFAGAVASWGISGYENVYVGSFIWAATISYLTWFVLTTRWARANLPKDYFPNRTVVFVSAVVGVAVYLTFSPRIWVETESLPYPATLITAKMPVVRSGTPVLKAGHVTRIDVTIWNQGENLARNVEWGAMLKTPETPVSRTEEKLVLDKWSSQMKLLSKKDLAPNDGEWSNFNLRFYKDTVEAVRNEIRRLYILIKFSWEDSSGMHQGEKCVYLRPPGTDDVWRKCDSHNFVQ